MRNLKTNSTLLDRHIEIATKYPTICKLNKDDNVLEFYCDNQTLSSLRSCQGYFRESFINNLEPKPTGIWTDANGQENLDIGIWFHSTMEVIDKALFNNKALSETEALFIAKDIWVKNNIERYRETKAYESMDGMIGAMQMVKDYMQFYNPAQDNLKIIATELVFGYEKEAPIVDWELEEQNTEATYPYRAYLVGRPDGIVESPLGIGPKDYKTSSRIDTVRDLYKPSEQLLGYVYGINKILDRLGQYGKSCNMAYLIAVNKKPTKNGKDRVLKIPYTYSPGDLEAYRKRQVATFDSLYEQLVLNEESVWDTSKCCNWYYRKCPFHKLHSSVSEQRNAMIEAFYRTKAPWNPRTRGKEETE